MHSGVGSRVKKRINKLSGESLKQMDIPEAAFAFIQAQSTEFSMPELWHYRSCIHVQRHILYR